MNIKPKVLIIRIIILVLGISSLLLSLGLMLVSIYLTQEDFPYVWQWMQWSRFIYGCIGIFGTFVSWKFLRFKEFGRRRFLFFSLIYVVLSFLLFIMGLLWALMRGLSVDAMYAIAFGLVYSILSWAIYFVFRFFLTRPIVKEQFK